MADEHDPPPPTGARAPDADHVLDYVHGRYRRRKRIQQGSLSVMTVVVVTVAIVAGVDNFRSSRSVRSVGSGGGSSSSTTSVSSRSCGAGTQSGSGSVASNATASNVADAVVNLTVTLTQGESADSGMIISPTGEVLTTNNAIAGATSIKVVIGGRGNAHTAHVVGYDATDDIALLQIDGVSNLETVPFGDASKVKIGDPVVAIGNDSRGGPPVSQRGKVTALDQSATGGTAGDGTSVTLHGTIESELAVPVAGGGGPLVNAQGDVIGMNDIQDSGVSYAIPINAAATVVAQICRGGNTTGKLHIGPVAILGVQINSSGQSSSGAAVSAVNAKSAAADAGIKAGDTITSINGKSIANNDALHLALTPYRPGDRVTVGWVDTAGAKHAVAVKLGAGPPE